MQGGTRGAGLRAGTYAPVEGGGEGRGTPDLENVCCNNETTVIPELSCEKSLHYHRRFEGDGGVIEMDH